MRGHRHLLNRKGHFYFRIVIPVKLLPIVGCRELCYSLRTQNKAEAVYRCLGLQQIVRCIFIMIESGAELEKGQVKSIIRQYFSEALQRLEEQMNEGRDKARKMSLVMQEAKKNLNAQQLEVVKGLEANEMYRRLDYMVPADFEHPKDSEGKRVRQAYSPFFFDGDPKRVLKYLLSEHDLALPDYDPRLRTH